MGAWGFGLLDNDTILDVLEAVKATDLSKFLDIATKEPQPGYLDDDDGQVLIAVGIIIDRVTNGTAYNPNIDGFNEWAQLQDPAIARKYQEAAVKGLYRVIGEESETHELNAEDAGEGYQEWMTSMKDLIQRLEVLYSANDN